MLERVIKNTKEIKQAISSSSKKSDQENSSNNDMLTLFKKLSDSTNYYEIPIQKGLTIDMSSYSHMLICGVTGFGKSYFINYIIAMASYKGAVLFLNDPKNSDLALLSNYIPEENVAVRTEDIIAQVKKVREIMDERYERINELKVGTKDINQMFNDFDVPMIMLVLEEMGALVASLSRKQKDEFNDHLKQILLQGRQAGVQVLLVTQQPNTNNIPSEIRDQCNFRVFLGNPKTQAKSMIFGDNHEYMERTYDVGEGLYMLEGKTQDPKLIQTPYYDGKAFRSIYEQVYEPQYVYRDNSDSVYMNLYTELSGTTSDVSDKEGVEV